MSHYQSPPSDCTLPHDEVHVWSLSTALEPAIIQQLASNLSNDERKRADRFHFEVDRRRYLIARGGLRRLLGHYLGVAPSELEFSYGAQGKPALASHTDGGLSFNLAHAHEIVLYAVAWQRELGIDVEFVRPMPDARAIALSHFTPAEAPLLQNSATGPEEMFFRLWARKESIIKAIGVGLSMPLNQFDVSSVAPADGSWMRVAVPAHDPSTWVVRDLPAPDGYRAALALEQQQPAAVRLWHGLPAADSY
jgi:4'-phosphopantetheinyl transferase